jgi:outer membrane protein OmpA-like peptidoglycan-associated protein
VRLVLLALLGVVSTPAPRQHVVVRRTTIEILDQLRFDANSARLDADGTALLDVIVTVLNENPELLLLGVEGHASKDERDPQAISEARADAVVAYLVKHKIARERLSPSGHGASKPLEKGDGPSARAKNRRVEFVILKRKE